MQHLDFETDREGNKLEVGVGVVPLKLTQLLCRKINDILFLTLYFYQQNTLKL